MFELPPEERYAANIYDKILTHSHYLRKGLVESLALLGSHPKALTSCTIGKAETTAVLAVREILEGADWMLWASLNDLLPLLAEAAPGEFLDAVKGSLDKESCPFDIIFKQERDGIMGRNYITGLLWALETLAWDADYLVRVVVILGELAARDPGGNWSNRPENSLSTILLPWMPQTCAPIAKRKAALETLLKEFPDVAWKLLLNLLPSATHMSMGSRKPAWREIIIDDWSKGVTNQEYWEQISVYAELAIIEAESNFAKLISIINRLNDLPLLACDKLLTYLSSEKVGSMSKADRARLWKELVDFVSKHRKFVDAKWAMKPEMVNKIAVIAEGLAPDTPIYRHQRLFSEGDFDLYEEKGNYDEQRKKLEEKRLKAVGEVFESGGVEIVLEFAKAVESPWQVGFAFGVIAANDVEDRIFPALLESETKSLTQFAGGFVWGRFSERSWQWIDEIDMSQWLPSQKGQLLAYLPFTSDTWERAVRLLGEDESLYWYRTNANPYDANKGLELAIDRLLEHGREYPAIRCLAKILHDKRPLDNKQAIRVLQAVLHSSERASAMDVHDTIEVIKALQDDPDTNPADLFQIEWAFLPLLDRDHGSFPKLLEQRLADDPTFFCEIIRTVFRSKREDRPTEEPTQKQKYIAENAYRLLSNWRNIPGSQKGGAFNGDALTAWLADVKAICAESGHLEIALQMVGHVLIHTLPDPDGLWIHHSVAKALNAKDAKDMRIGFKIELYNSRGIHSWTAGQDEREIATKYREQAEEVESHGYHRLSISLKELADSYERDAEWEKSRGTFDD